MRFHFTHLTFHARGPAAVNGKENSRRNENICSGTLTNTVAAVTSRCGKILSSSIVADDQWARHAHWPAIVRFHVPQRPTSFNERENASIFAFNLRQ